MADFKAINYFLSDYLAYSGMLVFNSDKDSRSYHHGTHCYVLCPVCGAKTSCEMIKGMRCFKSWQCSHLSSSSPLDFFMLARGIDNLPVAVKEAEELMNIRVADCGGICICNHIPSDKSEALRKKNIELAETAFEKRDENITAEYLKMRGIDYSLLPDTIRQDIAYTARLEQISQSTGKTFFISGVSFRNRFKDSVSFSVRRTEGMEYVRSDFRVLQIGKILPFGLKGIAKAKTVAIAEGAFDALSLYAADLPAISISGVANAGKVLGYIPESCSNVVIALDNDSAGVTAALTLFDILRTSGIRATRLRIEKGKDANEWLCSDPKGFYEAVRKENSL